MVAWGGAGLERRAVSCGTCHVCPGGDSQVAAGGPCLELSDRTRLVLSTAVLMVNQGAGRGGACRVVGTRPDGIPEAWGLGPEDRDRGRWRLGAQVGCPSETKTFPGHSEKGHPL